MSKLIALHVLVAVNAANESVDVMQFQNLVNKARRLQGQLMHGTVHTLLVLLCFPTQLAAPIHPRA